MRNHNGGYKAGVSLVIAAMLGIVGVGLGAADEASAAVRGGLTVTRLSKFPVSGGCYYSDTWGAPRSGGRRHEGVDIIANEGTPLVAVTSGYIAKIVRDTPGSLGGNYFRLTAPDGTYFTYIHLSLCPWAQRGRSGASRTNTRLCRSYREHVRLAPALRSPSMGRTSGQPDLVGRRRRWVQIAPNPRRRWNAQPDSDAACSADDCGDKDLCARSRRLRQRVDRSEAHPDRDTRRRISWHPVWQSGDDHGHADGDDVGEGIHLAVRYECRAGWRHQADHDMARSGDDLNRSHHPRRWWPCVP